MRGLFIGIGGTGDEILAHLKDKVYASLGTIPDSLQFRLIDTEAEDYRRNKGARLGGEGSEAAIGGNEYLQLRDDPPGIFYNTARKVAEHHDSMPEVARWFRAEFFLKNLVEADFNLTRGAGQHRQFARMGMFLNKQRLVNMLRKALERCRSQNAEVPIWIIGSVAGGTGAGMFMDMALLARWVAEDMGISRRVIGASVLPDVFSDMGIDSARAYSVLRELERFQAPVEQGYLGRASSHSFRFSVTYDSSTTIRLPGPLFDNLVFYNRKCETEDERRNYFSEIADGLNLLLDESAGDQLFREWINVEEGYAASFNSYRIFLPARLYRRQFVLQAALEVADSLLPKDERTQILAWGSVEDRRAEAVKILSEENFKLFGILLKPESNKDFKDLSRDMTSDYIVNTMLGFSNPVGVFGMDIGETRDHCAKRLYANIFDNIATIQQEPEGFQDSKTRVKADVIKQRQQYESGGEGGFAASLDAIRSLVADQVRKMADESARKYLAASKANEQALGKATRVFKEIKDRLVQVRTHLQRLVTNDPREREQSKGHETDALVALDQLPKKFLRWKGQLHEYQRDYLDAAYGVVQWEQRELLTHFLLEMITVADQRFSLWLEGMQGWQQAIEQVTDLCRNENNDIHQRLERQTKIKSAAIGLKNTRDMDGYQAYLRERCLLDPNSGESYVQGLLTGLQWQPGQRPQDLMLKNWPDPQTELGARDFANALNEYLETRINKRMDSFEGMANYLEWLRDDKRDAVTGLSDRLTRVTTGFVDNQSTSATRKSLFLHGDLWGAEKQSKDEFNTVFNALQMNDNFSKTTHNLMSSDGVNQFKDRNVMAVLMVDNKIPYLEFPVVEKMRNAYLNERGQDTPRWRARAYHSFRCEQEAWTIERAQVLETGDIHFPLVPGQYVRLLDEPERVEMFAKALAAQVIRKQEAALGGNIWVCGPQGDDRRLIYLNNPEDRNDAGDLHRAMVTFVFDQRDRRPHKRGVLDLRQVRAWVTEQLGQTQRSMSQAVEEFLRDNPWVVDVPMDALEDDNPDETNKTRAFLGLVLKYYLTRT